MCDAGNKEDYRNGLDKHLHEIYGNPTRWSFSIPSFKSCDKREEKEPIWFFEISRAHLHSPVRKKTCPSCVSTLNLAMYGTNEADQSFDLSCERTAQIGCHIGMFNLFLCKHESSGHADWRTWCSGFTDAYVWTLRDACNAYLAQRWPELACAAKDISRSMKTSNEAPWAASDSAWKIENKLLWVSWMRRQKMTTQVAPRRDTRRALPRSWQASIFWGSTSMTQGGRRSWNFRSRTETKNFAMLRRGQASRIVAVLACQTLAHLCEWYISQDSSHCSSATKSKSSCLKWANFQNNLKDGSSSCWCSMTSHGDLNTMNRNVKQTSTSFPSLQEDFHQEDGYSSDLDQKRSGISLMTANHKENGTKALNWWC